jgi:hypothetical protein
MRPTNFPENLVSAASADVMGRVVQSARERPLSGLPTGVPAPWSRGVEPGGFPYDRERVSETSIVTAGCTVVKPMFGGLTP